MKGGVKGIRRLGGVVGFCLVLYLTFNAGLFLGLQPFGQSLLNWVGTPLITTKRAVLGLDHLISYGQYSADRKEALFFDGAPNPDYRSRRITGGDVLSALPKDVTPIQPTNGTLEGVMLNAVRGTLSGALKAHHVEQVRGGYVHTFDFGWTRPQFLSTKSVLGDRVAIVVPGSGIDEASSMLKGEGYQGDILGKIPCMSLIYVKPNHDTRQAVFRDKRLNFDYLYASLIAVNSIYSYWYIQELIDTALYLKANTRTQMVIGLSQGGAASVIVGAVAKLPITAALSGYYIPNTGVFGNAHQILIPGMSTFMLPENIGPHFSESKLLLTYGDQDLPLYRMPEVGREACLALENAGAKVTCLRHASGHVAPDNLRKLLEDMLQNDGSH